MEKHIVTIDENGVRSTGPTSEFEPQTDATAQRLKQEIEDLRQRREADAAACIAGLGISGASPAFVSVGPWVGM